MPDKFRLSNVFFASCGKWTAYIIFLFGALLTVFVLFWALTSAPRPLTRIRVLSQVDAISWAPDDNLIAVASGVINVYSPQSGQCYVKLSLNSQLEERNVAYIGADRVLCGQSDTGIVVERAWDDQGNIKEVPTCLPTSSRLLLSSDCSIVACINADIAIVTTRSSCKAISIISGDKYPRAVTSTGAVIFTSITPSGVGLLQSGKCIWFNPLTSHCDAVAVSSDFVIAGTENGDLFSLNAKTGNVEWMMSVSAVSITAMDIVLAYGIVVAADRSGEIYIVSLRNGSVVKSVETRRGEISVVAASHSGGYVAVGYRDCKCEIWTTKDLCGSAVR